MSYVWLDIISKGPNGFNNFGGGSKVFLSPMTSSFKVIPKN